MTGTGLLANYGKFLTCLALALVPGMAFGLLLLLWVHPVWRRPPSVPVLVLAIGATALLAGAIFGLVQRARAGGGCTMHLRVALLMQLGLLPLLTEAAAVRFLLTVGMPAMLGLYCLLYPLALVFGPRAPGWPRIWTCAGLAFAITLAAAIWGIGAGVEYLGATARTLLVALATIGFLPFAMAGRQA